MLSVYHTAINYTFLVFLDWEGEDILNITDKTHFHLLGYVSSQNSCVWFAHNPHEFEELLLCDEKVVWFEISCKHIVKATFFSETVNLPQYYNNIM